MQQRTCPTLRWSPRFWWCNWSLQNSWWRNQVGPSSSVGFQVPLLLVAQWKKVWSILTHQRLQLFLGLFNKVIVYFPNGKFAIWGIYSDFLSFFGDPLSKSKYFENLCNHKYPPPAAQMLQVLRNLGCFQRYARPALAARPLGFEMFGGDTKA